MLTKATKLQDTISTMVDEESDVAVMRSDRAADVSASTGFSDRHRQRGPKTSVTDRITHRISRSIEWRLELQSFLPRDAMRKRGVCCSPVSVCLSVCHVQLHLQTQFGENHHTAADIVKLLSRPGSSIILVFF